MDPTNISLCIFPSPSSMANQRLTGNSYTSLLPISSITTCRRHHHESLPSCVTLCPHVYTLSRNHPAEEPLLLCPMVIFLSLPRLGHSIVNLSSEPRSKLSLSLSSRLSPCVREKDYDENEALKWPWQHNWHREDLVHLCHRSPQRYLGRHLRLFHFPSYQQWRRSLCIYWLQHTSIRWFIQMRCQDI